MNFIKKIILALFILIISSAIFFLIEKDNSTETAKLRNTLESFGDELLTIVPEGPRKDYLMKKYQEFVEKAEDEQVSQKQIEEKAATILNFAVQDTTIPADKVIAALGFEEAMNHNPRPHPILPDQLDRIPRRFTIPHPGLAQSQEERDMMVQRLENSYKFYTKMQYYQQPDSNMHPRDRFFFSADSGIQINVNPHLKKKIETHDNNGYLPDFDQLEKDDLIKWTHDDQVFVDVETIIDNYLQEEETPEHVKGLLKIVSGVQHFLPESLNVTFQDSMDSNNVTIFLKGD